MTSQTILLQAFLERVHRRDVSVAIIGLGYVGLPLAVVFAEAGLTVVGIDLDPRKVELLNAGESYIEDVPTSRLAPLVQAGRLRATTDVAVLAECDAVSICVPTPLRKTGDPDISYIVDATEQIARYLHRGMLVVLESTTYPGTTSEVILPRLSDHQDGLRVGEDFFLCFSPERVDPGRTDWTTRNTPKVMGGQTPACLEAGQALYGVAIETVVPVSSPAAAEMTKLLENTFRSVNIGLVNEVLLMCEKLGLDAWEVIEAAASKPFGFMKFTPGPGLGGHCIPIDPLYLSWKLRTLDYTARFIELASEINTGMPRYWVQKVQDALNEASKSLKGSNVLVVGIAYKKDVSDMRESPALDIIHLLQDKGASVTYHDPYVPDVDHDGITMTSVPNLHAALADADCAIIVTDHSTYDWPTIHATARVIVDTRRTLR
ncbi:nucleotide sugar dehydrogenase [Candidatus Chloroploca asiatica]|uniref:UDP-N-acetyl-D-glucosamine dehydrogenase n=1 Tax=Candidatus Chloroploca asiatica TaxID=1506545 RepID=A0A2H3KPC7_9CHLR|nr:nucleotide sugar dehydrogenase [Candidatus Chloroploca asiatica]PDV99993.1 UDP-N-acetyl-D-glucosamine dehydrogenase [Candidatus Chloroploca asiatica]